MGFISCWSGGNLWFLEHWISLGLCGYSPDSQHGGGIWMVGFLEAEGWVPLPALFCHRSICSYPAPPRLHVVYMSRSWDKND